ncbi:MAG: 30S ribosome-binding factor RbfA [Chloroflexi bacterium]|nr:30S ribosome-binding factor RbfA [Chloroflexota bacterium]MDA1146397.1 30S ribosome-binding factor RbfA [Chloroflexota bacterium]MQC82267.1 30S ribosome-binding factor RbfA [Chloroflexota bacterium]MQC82674.1 30S ribosome-binding factor RbfA [Chloroflexota bacterium]PKB56494.1 MAG: ribosome-binding factor A [SAR202 cluster bacterium Casp-Chloro-G1]
MSRRTEQVGDLIQSVLADLIRRRLKHPALTNVMVSITRVEVTPDFAHATVHISVLGDDTLREEVMEGLRHSEGFLHREISKEVHLRRVPRLRFAHDRSMEEAERLTAIMRDVARSEGREL